MSCDTPRRAGVSTMLRLFRNRATEGTAEFYLRHPENLLLVKREKDGVLICATADNLSAEQRAAFVRYLNGEGFASGAFIEPPGWSPEPSPYGEVPAVRWIVDPNWPEIDPVYARNLQRLCWYAAGGTMAWLALVTVVIRC